jgi:hypothetical protein
MLSGFQITCANKNQQGVIVRIGGDGWSLSTREAILKLMTGQLRLNILLGDERYTIGIRGEGSESYLALEPDGRPLREIDGLRSC